MPLRTRGGPQPPRGEPNHRRRESEDNPRMRWNTCVASNATITLHCCDDTHTGVANPGQRRQWPAGVVDNNDFVIFKAQLLSQDALYGTRQGRPANRWNDRGTEHCTAIRSDVYIPM